MPSPKGVSIPPYLESALKAALQRVLRVVGRLLAELVREWLEGQLHEAESTSDSSSEGEAAAGDGDDEPHPRLPSPPSRTAPRGEPVEPSLPPGAEPRLPSGRGEDATERRAGLVGAAGPTPVVEELADAELALPGPAEAAAEERGTPTPPEEPGGFGGSAGEGYRQQGTVRVPRLRDGTVPDGTPTPAPGVGQPQAEAVAAPRTSETVARSQSGFVARGGPGAADYPRGDLEGAVEAIIERLIEEGRLIDRRALEEFHRRMQREQMTESLF